MQGGGGGLTSPGRCLNMGGTGLRMEEKSKTDTDGPEERPPT